MERYTVTIMELLENNVEIFDFDYPFYNEEMKKDFEKQFLDYFMFREIGIVPVAKWKHYLKTKLNLIMPYWNKILLADNLEQRILDNYDVTETSERTVMNDSSTSSTGSSKDVTSTNPMTRKSLDSVDFADTIGQGESSMTSNGESLTTEKYTFNKKGNIGIQTDADAIVKYWESLRKIYLEIFTELEYLFMGVM